MHIGKGNYSITISNEDYIKLLQQNQEILSEFGLSYTENEEKRSISLYNASVNNGDLPIQDKIDGLRSQLGQIYTMLGIRQETSTEILAKQTLGEQGDTTRKVKMTGEMENLISRMREDPNNVVDVPSN